MPNPPVKTLYLIRHCKATGQAAGAPLTEAGQAQALALAQRLADAGIERIVASPFRRAQQSVEPLALRLGLPLESDDRLVERTLAAADLPDWLDHLRASFDNFDLCLPGGESNRTAQARGVDALGAILAHGTSTTAVVTHGNLMTLLLHHFDPRFGFDAWRTLTNPDIYRVVVPAPGTGTGANADAASVERIPLE